MTRERLEIQRLSSFVADGFDQPRFARPGQAADHAIPKRVGQVAEHRNDVPAIRTIAAVELHRAKPDLAKHVRERAAALAAAPAVDERGPFARLVAHVRFDDARDVARDDRRARLARVEGGLLHVHRADVRALVVVEHRQVHGAGQMVLGKLGR